MRMSMENGTQNIQAAKKALRREVLQRREKLSEDTRTKAALLLTERILGHQWYYLSNRILSFVSYGSEICTTEILENALQDGKEVYVPKVEGREMQFYRIRSLTELKEGYKGIREPEGNTESYVFTSENAAGSLFLMPGSVFDPLGNRLGYGGGFYDCYFERYKGNFYKIALAYECQMVHELPVEPTDYPVDMIITEENIYE